MDILVDFDNLDPQAKQAGLVQLCTRMVNAIACSKMKFPERCRVRLYGGWYEGDQLTFQADDLIGAIAENHNAIVVPWQAGPSKGNALVQLEMAYGLEIEPGRHLFQTLRTRAFSEHISCDHRRLSQCHRPGCPLGVVAEFFKRKRCPNGECRMTPGDIFRKSEQKLVDTMLTADLIFLGKDGRELGVVSSDDDLWPGIQTALISGAHVVHVHTRQGMKTPTAYVSGLVEYRQTILR